MLQPIQCVGSLQSLGRKIEKTEGAASRLTHDAGLFFAAESAIENRRRNPHLSELCGLILHERDQRRNDDSRLLRHDCRKLIAERLSSASRHNDTSVSTGEKAADDPLLERSEGVVTPIAAQRSKQIRLWGHGMSIGVSLREN